MPIRGRVVGAAAELSCHARLLPMSHADDPRASNGHNHDRSQEGIVTLNSIGRIEACSAARQLQAATFAATFHSAMALRR
jgi:hypothetical protein